MRFLITFLFLIQLFFPVRSWAVEYQELTLSVQKNRNEVKTSGELSRSIQKYTGFSKLVEVLFEQFGESYLKSNLNSKELDLDIYSYSGIDLLLKKAKGFFIYSNNSYLKELPVEHLGVYSEGPIQLFKNSKGKLRSKSNFNIQTKATVDIDDIVETLNESSYWEEKLESFKLSLPPFGKVKLPLSNVRINVDDNGKTSIKFQLKNTSNTSFTDITIYGLLKIKYKRLVLDDIRVDLGEVLISSNSQLSKAVNQFVSDLVNPIIKFDKYQRKNFRINNVQMFINSGNIDIDLASEVKVYKK